MNIWMLLLAGLALFMRSVVAPLFGGVGGYHQAMGMANTLGQGVTVVIELVVVTFGVFDLRLIAFALGISLTIWLVGAGVKIYLFIKRLIPFAG